MIMKFDEVTLSLEIVKERKMIQEEQPRNSKDLSGERSVRRILGDRQVHSPKYKVNKYKADLSHSCFISSKVL